MGYAPSAKLELLELLVELLELSLCELLDVLLLLELLLELVLCELGLLLLVEIELLLVLMLLSELLELLVLWLLVEIELLLLELLLELLDKSSTPSKRGCPLWAKSVGLRNKLEGRNACPSKVSCSRTSSRRSSGKTSETVSSVPASVVVVRKSAGWTSTAQTVTTRESSPAWPGPR